MEGRDTFLPYHHTLPGSVMDQRTYAVPGAIAGMINAVTAPRRAYQGGYIADENGNIIPAFNAEEEAANTALSVMGGGFGASRAAGGAPSGALGMFIGKSAKNWDAAAAAKAIQMEKAGIDPRVIWEQTGTWKGPEGQWRQEISDKTSKITEDVYNQISSNKQFKGSMGQALQHEELFKAYPQTAGIHTTMYADEIPSGSLMPGRGGTFQTPLLTVGGPSSMAQRNTALHELQHAIQQKEGFSPGGSPSNMITELEKIAKQKRQQAQNQFRLSSANDPLDPLRIVKPGARKKGLELEKEARELEEKALLASNSGQSRFDLYRKLAGEAEARATQKRRNLTNEERRSIFPLESYDVPINQLIFR